MQNPVIPAKAGIQSVNNFLLKQNVPSEFVRYAG